MIQFAIEKITRVKKSHWQHTKVHIVGCVLKEDLPAFQDIRNAHVFFKDLPIWSDPEEAEFTIVNELIVKGYPDALCVDCWIDDTMNFTQGFFKATGIQLDDRFLRPEPE